MDWIQFALFFVSMVGLFIGLFMWNRTEGRADVRHFENLIHSFQLAIQQEIKDFHGRLERQDAEFRMRFLAIEERRKLPADTAKELLEELRKLKV